MHTRATATATAIAIARNLTKYSSVTTCRQAAGEAADM